MKLTGDKLYACAKQINSASECNLDSESGIKKKAPGQAVAVMPLKLFRFV
jgi:hypothetical protein